MEKPKRHIPAFLEPLEHVRDRKPGIPVIESMEKDGKEWIVRAFKEPDLQHYNYEDPPGRPFLERALIVKKLFDELAEYDIRVPVEFVIGEDDGKVPTLFILTEKIEKQEALDREALFKEQETTLRNLFRYYQKKHAANEDFLCDVADLGQYVYGTRPGEADSHLYLVDTDPYYGPSNSSRRYPRLLSAISGIIRSIEYMEREYGVDFTDFHDECVIFYNSFIKKKEPPVL